MKRVAGFTLIELLVVISIIALLISILLPSIEAARAQAQAVVCTTKLKDIYNAQNNYAFEFSDWLAGARGTTGAELQLLPPEDFDQFATDTPGVPVQNWDWQTPLAHYGLGHAGLPRERNARWQRLREMKQLTCPSNNFVVPPYPDEAINNDWPVMLMNSYSTIREFMYFGFDSDEPTDPMRIPQFWRVETPIGHAPRLTHIERASSKGMVVEGARFLRSDLPSPDYNVNYRGSIAGGNFATAGPSSSWSRSFINPVHLDNLQHDPKWDRYSYRHPVAGAPGFNTLFFDGHADRMSKTTAVESVDTWLPSGTKVPVEEYDGSEGSSVAKPRAVRIIEQREPDKEGLYPIR